MKNIINRVIYVLMQEGCSSLIRRVFDYLVQRLFVRKSYYLIEHPIVDMNEGDFLPRVEEYTFLIISTIEDANKLVSNGIDFYSISLNTKERIERGAIAFCILVGKDIAHIAWLALNKEAKDSFQPFPYRVDFQNGEACTGGAFTMPKYEGKGMMAYVLYKRLDFLRERGVSKALNIIETSNAASINVNSKFPNKICARVKFTRLLWWQSWRETTLDVESSLNSSSH